MPTGYTAPVQSGKITDFAAFAMQCARAFGALITMRDESPEAPIPERFEPTDHHARELQVAVARLAELQAMTPEEVARASVKAHADAYTSWLERERTRREQRGRYELMLAQVDAWEPPTDAHEGLKRFMREQLTESIRFDCGEPYPEPVSPGPAEWLATQVEKAEWSAAYHTKADQEERERVEGRNRWLAALRASLVRAA